MSGALCAMVGGGSGPFTVNVSPLSLYQSGTTNIITTASPFVVSIIGGVGPFTCSWSFSGDATNWSFQSPTASSTQVTCAGMFPGVSRIIDVLVQVTDTGTGFTVSGPSRQVTIERV